MIRTREEVLAEIQSKPELFAVFQGWKEEHQDEFLDCVTGVKGVKVLYDAFFKEIMNPETAPERLEEFLSLLLGEHVKIKCALPTDNSRVADESSLVIMDILIELEDGSLANLEAQKVGYMFPGQRIECYPADLLLRQYKRVRSKKRKKFSYRDIKSVYNIVLFESSPEEFHKFPNVYIHRSEQKSDTGIKIELLQKYVFIPIDIFKKTQHNKNITGKLNAWLMFFSAEEPEEIVKLIQAYPQFKPMYEEAYEMCRNMEEIMGLFSKELRELDRNTVQLMIDEMQEDLEQKKAELKKQKNVAEAERLRADRLEESERQKSEQLEQALRRIAELERQRG